MAARSTYHAATDVGQERELNEDCHGELELDDGGLLLVVCDGMGGHEGGEVASRIAVDAIGQIFQNSPADDPREKLANGFRVANQRILAEAERAGAEGMGTTAVAVYVRGSQFTSAHVGDSRVYHVRGGEVLWHTLDHTRVQKMVDKGILTQEEAKSHPDANVVTRALGYRETADGEPIEADVAPRPREMKAGDTLILCSDGLYDGVSDQEIADTVTGVEPEVAAQALVDFANERGGHDNITVCVVRFGEAPAKAKAAAKTADKGRGSVRITDLDEPATGPKRAPGAPSAAGSGKRAEPATGPAEHGDEKKRRFAAIFMFAIAAIIVGLVVYLMFLRGGGGGSSTTPSAAPGGEAAGGGATSPAGDGDGVTPAGSGPATHHPGDAPPLPENPILGGPGKPKKPGGAASGVDDGADDPGDSTPVPLSPGGVGGAIPVPQGGAPPPGAPPKKAPASNAPGATHPATKPPATAKPPATTSPSTSKPTKPPVVP